MAQTQTGVKPHVYPRPPYTDIFIRENFEKRVEMLSNGFDFLDNPAYKPSDEDFLNHNSGFVLYNMLGNNQNIDEQARYYNSDSEDASQAFRQDRDNYIRFRMDYIILSYDGLQEDWLDYNGNWGWSSEGRGVKRLFKKRDAISSSRRWDNQEPMRYIYATGSSMMPFPQVLEGNIFYKQPLMAHDMLLSPSLDTIGQLIGYNEFDWVANFLYPATFSNAAYPAWHPTKKYYPGDIVIGGSQNPTGFGGGDWVAYQCVATHSRYNPDAQDSTEDGTYINRYWIEAGVSPSIDPELPITVEQNSIKSEYEQDINDRQGYGFMNYEYWNMDSSAFPFYKYLSGRELTEEESAGLSASKAAFERSLSREEYWPNAWSNHDSPWFAYGFGTVSTKDAWGNFHGDFSNVGRLSDTVSETNWLPMAISNDQLPATASNGDFIRVKNDYVRGEQYASYSWDERDQKWISEYNGNSILSRMEDLSGTYRAHRDARFKALNELELSIKPFTWAALHLPDYSIRKDIMG